MTGRKKILLVSSAFYPEISPRSFRATELAKEFYKQGHKVVVISKYRDHDYSGFLNENKISLKMWGESRFPIIPDFKWKPLSVLSRGISRILAILFEYPAIEELFQVKKILRHEDGYDLMISFSVPYPVHWGVARARSKKQPIAKIWVADCGDPYMFARLDTFRKPFYFKSLEINFCRKCDCLAIPVKDMLEQFYPQFISKIKIIPQGLNFEEIQVHNEPINNNKPTFIFAGSIIPGKRDLNLFLEFLISLPTDFLFIVYTIQEELFNKYKLALGKKLELRGYVDRLSLIFEMSKADFVVNVDTIFDNQSHIEAVPSKLIDYALSNRPILNISSAQLDKELVTEFLNNNYSGQKHIEKSIYNIKNVSAKFLELLN